MKKTEKRTHEPYESPRSEVVEIFFEGHIMEISSVGIDDITVEDDWDWDLL